MLACELCALRDDLPAIAMCAGIAVGQRAWRWQAAGRRVGNGQATTINGHYPGSPVR